MLYTGNVARHFYLLFTRLSFLSYSLKGKFWNFLLFYSSENFLSYNIDQNNVIRFAHEGYIDNEYNFKDKIDNENKSDQNLL